MSRDSSRNDSKDVGGRAQTLRWLPCPRLRLGLRAGDRGGPGDEPRLIPGASKTRPRSPNQHILTSVFTLRIVSQTSLELVARPFATFVEVAFLRLRDNFSSASAFRVPHSYSISIGSMKS